MADSSKESNQNQQQLDHAVDVAASALAGVYLAGNAFFESWFNPTVRQTLRRVATTIMLTAALQHAVFLLLLMPIDAVVTLVGWLLRTGWSLSVRATASAAMVLYPLITLRIVKLRYRRHLEECFFSQLQSLDPGYASELAARERSYKVDGPTRLKEKLLHTVIEPGDDPWMMLLLPVLVPLLRLWRTTPYIGPVLSPVAQFLSIRYLVGRPVAAAGLTALATLAPLSQRPVMKFVELWASAKLLGSSSMRHFLERSLPADKRSAFVRTYEYSIVCYYFLPTWAMQLPVVGALATFPAAAMAAFLVHDIMSRPEVTRVTEEWGRPKNTTGEIQHQQHQQQQQEREQQLRSKPQVQYAPAMGAVAHVVAGSQQRQQQGVTMQHLSPGRAALAAELKSQ